MALHPPRPHSRLWRWLAGGALLAVLLAAYWVVLQRVGEQLGDDLDQALRPIPAQDLHTPRVY